MFCPNCRYEYEEGIEFCPDCKTKLVEKLPPESKYEYIELVTVLVTTNYSLLTVARSLLDDVGIGYFIKNEREQDLFALGQLGTGFNPLIGPMQLQVAEEDVEDSVKLLKDLVREEE